MESGNIKLGLNLPLFIAAIIAMGTGTLVGMMGIWGAAAWGRPVPEWEKVGHAQQFMVGCPDHDCGDGHPQSKH